MYVPRAMYSFKTSFCTVPEIFARLAPCFLANRHVEAKQNRRGGVNSHRSGKLFERNAVEKRFHIFERIDRDADFADFTKRERMIRVHPDLCR